jgi:hypothetical protein
MSLILGPGTDALDPLLVDPATRRNLSGAYGSAVEPEFRDGAAKIIESIRANG